MSVLKHDQKDYQLRWGVVIIPLVIFAVIFVMGIVNQDLFMSFLNKVFSFIMIDFGWAINLGSLFFVIFCFICLFHPMAKIKFGGPDAKPELTVFEWFSISLCAGMATGLILWPTAEMIEYSLHPAIGAGLEPGSYKAIIWALTNEMLHWSFTPYGLYTAFGIVCAYVYYNLNLPFAVSSTLYPVIGDRAFGKIGTVVDSITLFSIMGGVAGSLGYGLLQLGSGLEFLFGFKSGPALWSIIALVMIIIYTISSTTGLQKGIRWLSEKNAWLFIFFLAFATIFGPTSFMLNLTTEAIGEFIANFIPLMTFLDPITGSDLWPQWWGTVWWLDWLAFAPLTGLFLARLCKGRTIREFIIVNLILPALFAIFWFGMFGSLAAHIQYIMGEPLGQVLAENGHQFMQLYTLKYLPLTGLLRPLLLLTQVISIVTLADSMTSTVSMMTIKRGKNYHSEEAPVGLKVFWGVVMGAISVLFLYSGGLDGAKSVKIMSGFPILILEFVVLVGFLRFFAKGKAPEKFINTTDVKYTNNFNDSIIEKEVI
jgi:choline-glycine betaine transporter